MSRAWILQANPKHYDIDGALAKLSRIWWRVPQYTADIRAGDVVLLWRSGKEAGFVGVGRVIEPPQQHEMDVSEQRFVLSEDEPPGPATRALVALEATPFVAKERVRAIPELSEHQIVRAPMGTVFPLSPDEWLALSPHLTRPPDPSTAEDSLLPRVFAWDQRAKGVLPMPGGYDGYLQSTRATCRLVDEKRPTTAELADGMASRFDLTVKGARIRESFLRKMGLVLIDNGVCQISEWGRKWLDSDEAEILVALLHCRCRFIGEMLAELITPRTTEDLLSVANDRYGLGWDTLTQVNNRRGWLQSAGMLVADSDKKLVVTDRGRTLLPRLDLHPPRDSQVIEASPQPVPTPPIEEPSAEGGVSANEGLFDVDLLSQEILDSATDSADPNRFERAVRDAFAFLGFDAEWLGGAGKTDVLLDAPLGKGGAYRVAVDAKTTASGALTDGQVDWITLKDHRTKHDADYTMLVAPSPSPGRLIERAADQGAAVLSAKQLAGLCRQHARTPLGLADYRQLFAVGGEVDTGALDEQAEEQARLVQLAVAVREELAVRSPKFGPLTARDLWMVLADADAGEVASEEEIQGLLDTLSSPLVRVVDGSPPAGYVLASAPEVARRRLRLLGDAITQGSTD